MFKKIKDDSGAGATILGLAMMIFILIIGVFVSDLLKVVYVKSAVRRMAQTATLTAIKEQDRIGGLKPSSAKVLVDEYKSMRDGNRKETSTYDISAFRGPCDVGNTQYPIINIRYDDGRKVGAQSPVYTSVAGSVPNMPSSSAFYDKQYKAIQVEVVDITHYDFLSIFGNKCGEIRVQSSAIGTGHFDEEN